MATTKFMDKNVVFSRDYYYGRKYSNYRNYDKYDNDRYWQPGIDKLKKLNARGKILDIGCAFGFFLKRAAPLFDEIHGVDISQFAISRAKTLLPSGHFSQLDLDTDEIPYPDEYFDVITALDILEHTQSIRGSLKKIVPKLKHGGILIAAVPLQGSWVNRILQYLDKEVSHVDVPTEQEFLEMVKQSGLSVIQKEYFLNAIYFRIHGIPVDIELILQKV